MIPVRGNGPGKVLRGYREENGLCGTAGSRFEESGSRQHMKYGGVAGERRQFGI